MTQVKYYCCFDYDTFEPCTPILEVRVFKNRPWSPVCKNKFQHTMLHLKNMSYG